MPAGRLLACESFAPRGIIGSGGPLCSWSAMTLGEKHARDPVFLARALGNVTRLTRSVRLGSGARLCHEILWKATIPPGNGPALWLLVRFNPCLTIAWNAWRISAVLSA